jgi:hypothetical protein
MLHHHAGRITLHGRLGLGWMGAWGASGGRVTGTAGAGGLGAGPGGEENGLRDRQELQMLSTELRFAGVDVAADDLRASLRSP